MAGLSPCPIGPPGASLPAGGALAQALAVRGALRLPANGWRCAPPFQSKESPNPLAR